MVALWVAEWDAPDGLVVGVGVSAGEIVALTEDEALFPLLEEDGVCRDTDAEGVTGETLDVALEVPVCVGGGVMVLLPDADAVPLPDDEGVWPLLLPDTVGVSAGVIVLLVVRLCDAVPAVGVLADSDGVEDIVAVDVFDRKG